MEIAHSLAAFAVYGLIMTPRGIPLLEDQTKPKPRYWKLIGGKGKGGWDPIRVLINKTSEKTGIVIQSEEITMISSVEQARNLADGGTLTHWMHFCVVNIRWAPLHIRFRRSRGEVVRYFSVEQLAPGEAWVLPSHWEFVRTQLFTDGAGSRPLVAS